MKQEKEKTPTVAHSRWEEDSEEEQEPTESGRASQEPPVATNNFMKRPENAIFQRAISAIKPKTIEIKLRPERRVLLDSTAEKVTSELDLDLEPMSTSVDQVVSLRLAAPAPKAVPALVSEAKLDEKKSVRERLGDKVEPEQASGKAEPDAPSKESKPKEKKESKKDKRSQSKDKVILRFVICCVRPNLTLVAERAGAQGSRQREEEPLERQGEEAQEER